MAKKWLIVFFCALLLTIPAYAQDEEPPADDPVAVELSELEQRLEALTVMQGTPTAASDNTPSGLSILILLIGVAGIGAVGMAVIQRESFDDDKTA